MAGKPRGAPTRVPKSTSRVLDYSCGHRERSRLTLPPGIRLTSPERRQRWIDAEFNQRVHGQCKTCHATSALPSIEQREAALTEDYGAALPTYTEHPLALAVRVRDLRLKVIDGILNELDAPDYAQHMLVVTVLLAAVPGATTLDAPDRLGATRRVHATRLLREVASHADPRYWLLRTAHGARSYALGAALARDLRYLLVALIFGGQRLTPGEAEALFEQMLDRSQPDDLDLFGTGFADGLTLPEILSRRAFLAALTHTGHTTSAEW